MRSRCALALTIALFGCGGSDGEVVDSDLEPTPDGGGGSEPTGPVVPPTQLLPGSPGLVAVTSDGYAIYRAETAMGAVKLEAGATPATIIEKPGTVFISRNVVFNWAS